MVTETRPRKPLEYNATLIHSENLSEQLAVFRVRPDPDEAQDGPRKGWGFIPGQQALFGLNNEREPEKGPVRRPYSMASAPKEGRWLEFYIRLASQPHTDNPLTPLLWRLKAGDRLWLGPRFSGRFTLQHTIGDDDRRMKILVAAGSGLSPFVSIIRHGLGTGTRRKEPEAGYVVLHGARHPHELGFREDLERLMNGAQQRYFPTVSASPPPTGWERDTGRVETFFEARKMESLEQRLGCAPGHITPERCVVFVCGRQATITETLIRLLPRGFVPNDKRIRAALRLPEDLPPSLFYEQYDTAPVINLDDEELLEALRSALPQRINGR